MFAVLQLAALDMPSWPMHKEHMKEAAQRNADVEKRGLRKIDFRVEVTYRRRPGVAAPKAIAPSVALS